jgi:uncharacterized protein (DUF58 family)
MEQDKTTKGVYASLDELIQMKFQATVFSFRSKQPVQSILSGRHASRLRGRGLDFEELRHYLPGDDIRAMDWKATRRTGKPQVRVYSEEKERPCMLVLDQRLSMFFGSRVEMKSVTGAKLAALAAWQMVQSQDRAGCVVFNDTNLVHVRPRRSQKTVLRILKTISALNHELGVDRGIVPDSGMLDKALDTLIRRTPHDHIIAVISDFSGLTDETHRLVRLLSRHNDVIVFFVYDPTAKTMPEKGQIVISDGQRQILMDLEQDRIQKKGPQVLRSRYEGLLARLSAYGVPVLPVNTVQAVDEQIRMLLGKKKIEL